MNTKTSKEIDHNRRRFFGTAAMALAATQLGMFGSANAQSGGVKPGDVPATRPGAHTSFAPLKQIDCRRPEYRLRRSRPSRRSCGNSAARLALRHLQLRRCRPIASIEGLPRDCSLSSRLWHDDLSLQRNHAERPAVGCRPRHHRSDGCTQDPESHRRRL